MILHPDKPTGDEERFQKLAKAYEALSDPEARANWEKYGNPDGKQALEVALGLPSILVHAQGKYVFLAVYILLLGIAVPAVMRAFYRKSLKRIDVATGDCGLIPETNKWIGFLLAPVMDLSRMPTILGGIVESRPAVTFAARELDELTLIMNDFTGVSGGRRVMDTPPRYTQYFIEKDNADLAFGLVLGNTLLMTAHLLRRPLISPILAAHRDEMLRKMPSVVECGALYAIINTWRAQEALAPRHFQAAFDMWLDFGARMTQAVGLKDSFEGVPVAFRQLLNAQQWERLAGGASMSTVKSFRDFLAQPPAARLALCSTAAKDEKLGLELTTLAGDFPLLDGAALAFVHGEALASENDILTVRCILRHANVDGLGPLPRAPPAVDRVLTTDPSGPKLPRPFAPALPNDVIEEWHIFVEDSLTGRLVPNAYLKWSPLQAVETLNFHFAAQLPPGKRVFRVHVKSALYLGLNVVLETPS